MLLLSLFYASVLVAQTPEPYAWPLSQPRALTSSFGEYRYDRFHMGIDLRTGPIGKEVFVAEAGYVSRIRCSPFGYGKVIYVQLDDGNSAIYAHLNDYIPELRDYVRRAQHDRKKYEVDLYPDPGAFRVTRGQLIGYSGQTGIGVPHLHWELRDRSGAPINPRLLNLEWPDDTAPQFRSALIIPTDPDTTINGDYLPVTVALKSDGTNRYAGGTVRVKGSVAVGIDTFDPANQGASKLGVHRIETLAGDERIYELKHDRISYLHTRDGAVAYHPYYLQNGRYLMQWPWPGVATEMYSDSKLGGVIEVDTEPTSVLVRAFDFFENSSEMVLTLGVADTNVVVPGIDAVLGAGKVLYDVIGEWLLISVQFSAPEGIAPKLLEFGIESGVGFDRVNATTFRARYQSPSGVTVVGLSIDHPRAGLDSGTGLPIEYRFVVGNTEAGRVRETQGGLDLDIPSDAVYGRLYITVGSATASASGELQPVGLRYRIWPEQAPLRDDIHVTVPLEAGTSTVGLGAYRRVGSTWRWMPSEVSGEVVQFGTRKLGTFQLMSDTTPPSLQAQPSSPSGTVRNFRPTIEFHVEDRGSGIADWTATYRDEWLLMAYDPELNLLSWEKDVALTEGDGKLVVEVTDNAGNVSTREFEFTIAAP